MKIKGPIRFYNILLVLLCLVLSYAMLNIIAMFISYPVNWFASITLSAFVILFIGASIGLLFEDRSKQGGMLLLAVFTPYIAFSLLEVNLFRLEGILLGLIAGFGMLYHAYNNNKFNVVANASKLFLTLFFGLFIAYLWPIIIDIVINESQRDVPHAYLSGFSDFSLIILSILAMILLYLILIKHIHGVNGSDVFVYGPSKSGKTLLLLALYNQFVNYYDGHRNEVILSSSGDEEYYRLENMLSELKHGNQPRSNQKTDLTLYSLDGKKGMKPIAFDFVDYGGEFTENLTPEDYKDAIEKLQLEIPDEEFESFIDKPMFIKRIKESYPKKIIYLLDQLVLTHVYKKLEMSSKIVFLIDGEHIASMHDDGERYLTRLFGQYSRIMELFGNEKSYAIVVTKTDKIKDITGIEDNSREAIEIERDIFEKLLEIDTFKEIRNRASKVPIYFYTVSVSGIATRDTEDNLITNLYPWRVDQLARFGY
ncbi:radical SAM protein [Methanosalsum natronophilum]|uniref:radical SAM protein n=1 Tax=Methanosalsum natronophilum TaxID=768733 RepID=UPI0021697F50|nr:radical SAM protein [Methanosalsum natronophilum]MCS3923911.1 putative integral membrane protein [Methanosalsum natronophilum]